MSVIAVHCIVSGRVQGVGFRYSTEHKARELGLAGWVRNRADGSVELVAQGHDDAVAAMLAWLGAGPRFANVSAVRTTDIEVDPALDGFGVRY
ncbi:MAG: acylphosphatase [Acidimicrobiia bacterium]|nr:acylphosphatase [Acidimicrobiia bacterium]